MMNVSRQIVERIREQYPVGCRVELIRMNDKYAPPPGTRGFVACVDDIGTIHVNWDNGSGLGVAYAEDECKRI